MNRKFIFLIALLSVINVQANLILCRNNYVQKSPQETITKLMSACVEGDLKKVEDLVYRWPGINAQDAHGRTAFYYAVMNRQHEVVKFLLSCPDIDINLSDNDGITPLVIAIENDDVTSVALLLSDKRTNLEMRDKKIKYTSLIHAIQSKSVHSEEIIKLLIDAGANVTAGIRKDGQFISAIDMAQKNGVHDSLLKLIRDKKIIIDSTSSRFFAYKVWGVTLARAHSNELVNQYIRHKSEQLRALYNSGINVNFTDIDNDTPLHTAIKYNDTELTKWLIEAGADVNAKNNKGQTPLHFATERIVLRAGKFRLKNANFCLRSSAMLLCLFKQNNLEEILISAGAYINAIDNADNTPLSLAISNHNKIAVEVLLKAGADIRSDYALAVDDKEIFQLFWDHMKKQNKNCVVQ